MNRLTEEEYVCGQEDPGKNLVDLFKIIASYKILYKIKLHDPLKYMRLILQCSTLRYTKSVLKCKMSQYNIGRFFPSSL